MSEHRETLLCSVGEEARRLFLHERLACAQAVLLALCRHFETGLGEDHARALGIGLGHGVGGSGCLCGSLSGAAMAVSLVLGSGSSPQSDSAIRKASRKLHQGFLDANSSTCCRVLVAKAKAEGRSRFRQCADFTAQAAELAAGLILDHGVRPRPLADPSPPAPRPSLLGKLRNRLAP